MRPSGGRPAVCVPHKNIFQDFQLKILDQLFDMMAKKRKTDHAVSEWTGVTRETIVSWRKKGSTAITKLETIAEYLDCDIIIKQKEKK